MPERRHEIGCKVTRDLDGFRNDLRLPDNTALGSIAIECRDASALPTLRRDRRAPVLRARGGRAHAEHASQNGVEKWLDELVWHS